MSQFPPDRSRYIDPRYAPPVPKRRTGLNRNVDAAVIEQLRKDNARLEQLVKKLKQETERLAGANSSLPEDSQLELMRGRKLARLVRQDDTVQFAGIGMNGIYDVEGYAECLMRKAHEVPHPDCSCGFYIPAKFGDQYGDPRQHWVLDVEFGGKVLDCGMGAIPAPARGYRASWQRVLSVTAPTLCAHCFADAEHVCMQFDNRIEALCPKCASARSNTGQEKPLTWVREHLATELVAPNLTNTLPEPSAVTLPVWEEEYLRYKALPNVPNPPYWPTIPSGSTYVPTWTGTLTATGTSTSFPSSIWVQSGPPIDTQGPITWTQNT